MRTAVVMLNALRRGSFVKKDTSVSTAVYCESNSPRDVDGDIVFIFMVRAE